LTVPSSFKPISGVAELSAELLAAELGVVSPVLGDELQPASANDKPSRTAVISEMYLFFITFLLLLVSKRNAPRFVGL